MNNFNNLIFDSFFNKSTSKTNHETLYNIDNNLIPGYIPNDNKKEYFYTHINYHSIKNALNLLVEKNNDKTFFTFVETGCSAHGTKSTLLWDKFVNYFDGNVFSVDLNASAVDNTNYLTSNKTLVTCSDSLKYLPTFKKSIDFLYLDSYDVDFLNPEPSAIHHLKEFNCIKHLLHKNSIVLIDDTPCSPEWLDNGEYNNLYNKLKDNFNPNMSGKGSLVNLELEKMGATKVLHQYQCLWVL